jgi:transposase-like protein
MKPLFCPNPKCRHHRGSIDEHCWYTRDGTYTSKVKGKIQRYLCALCGTKFSTQTFLIDYGVKKAVSYRYIFNQLKAGAGIRSIARDLLVSHNLVLNRCTRLARSALAVHATINDTLRLREDLVADGFESFVLSQYFPNNIHLLVGKDSQYLYGFDYAHLRRKGRMTKRQQTRRKELDDQCSSGRRTITVSFRSLMEQFERVRGSRTVEHTTLFTDEKREYKKVFTEYKRRLQHPDAVSHVQISSRKARTVRNRLFSVNYLDREIRKDCANHVRETVQYSRNVSHLMERLAIYRVYHNCVKPYRVDHPKLKHLTHAEMAGAAREVLQNELDLLFTQRRFFSRVNLCWSDALIWLRGLASPLRQTAQSVPLYAWA